MARPPAGARRRGGGGGEAVRKGPWTAEEDEVLLAHVRAHGPRDWSSIRSKGLLPRTGKSCRLRWVNKLRPNLKTGCKFSAEEERVVIELQAQFGNKWARIATYLTGRTDNDVKNFWSTRQKRLSRLLRAPLPSRANKTSTNAKKPAARHGRGLLMDQAPPAPMEGSSSGGQSIRAAAPFMEWRQDDAGRAPRGWTGSGLLGFEAPLPLQVAAPAAAGEASSSGVAHWEAPELPFDQYTYPLLDFWGMPDRYDDVVRPGFVDPGGMDDGLAYHGLLPLPPPPPLALPFFGVEFAPHNAVKDEPPDALCAGDFFDDLPPDMFDALDHLPPPPPPPSPSRTNSGL